jgi:hypothetical protein
MKLLFLVVALWGCTQKYADYDLIRKADFNKESYERPVTQIDVLAQGRDELGECFNQWLFFSNAEKEKNQQIPSLVRVLCPHKDYLMNASFRETWWTTIFFTQSCINIETQCAGPRTTK